MSDGKNRLVREGSGFLVFCLVGLFGLIVDAGALLALIEYFDLNAYAARGLSIAFAVSVTWAAHRLWTFRTVGNKRFPEWMRYQLTSAFGAATNFGIYSILLASQDGRSPFFALVISSICALVVNFLGARFYAFGARSFRPT
ncbi:MAG: GtrA family protein [Alphaproteobacteria bacterium]|nr:GtrA family protein [Alphaproteobacteria bacterium]